MDNYSVTYYGKPLEKFLYSIDLDNKTFGSKINNLVLDFTGFDDWTFKTGNGCTFRTGYRCTFMTTFNCTFKTSKYCTFMTSSRCTFDTGESCTFLLYDINTCKFKTYDDISTILDRNDNQRYVLTKEFINIQKIKNN